MQFTYIDLLPEDFKEKAEFTHEWARAEMRDIFTMFLPHVPKAELMRWCEEIYDDLAQEKFDQEFS